MDSQLIDKNGTRFATAQLAAASNARIDRLAAEREAAAKAEAEAWEAGLKSRYMATPGADEAGWQRQRADILAEARKQAALSADDDARTRFRRSYA